MRSIGRRFDIGTRRLGWYVGDGRCHSLDAANGVGYTSCNESEATTGIIIIIVVVVIVVIGAWSQTGIDENDDKKFEISDEVHNSFENQV